MKKVLVILVFLVLLGLLTGCAAKKEPVTTPTPEIIVTEKPTSTPTSTPTSSPTKKPTSNSSSSSSSKSSFTNKYGTPTTKCAHSGCNNYIASSGDTNCCTTHSRKCAECGKYIDEDATYCMDCLEKAAKKVTTNSSSSKKCDKSGCSNSATKVLKVTQPNGESERFNLCSSHYSEYKSYFNSKKGWKAE